MTFSGITDTKERVLLQAVSNSLFGTNYTFDDCVDWDAVLEESCKQAVCALCFDGVGQAKNIPQDISAKWLGYAGMYLRNTMSVNSNHAYLDTLMKKQDIPYCILKGTASEYYYPKPFLRAMGDVDFLVSKEHFEKATRCLINDGFTMTGEEHICHRVFRKDKMHFEMHFEPAGMPASENGKIAEAFFSDIFDEATPVTIEGARFTNPSPFHHGLTMLLHTYHHLLSEGVGLRHLCDWAVFVNAFTNEEFCDIFEDKLSRIGLWKFAQILSATSCHYLGLPHRQWFADVDGELCYAVIEDVFRGGNFGNKDKTRVQEGQMISNRGKDGIVSSKFLQLVKIKNAQAVTVFPFLKKMRFLCPFGFIFMGVRYSYCVITGKRNALNIKQASSNAEKRKQIYAQFRLFEKGD